MKPPIIINDSQNPKLSGDLCVYDSVEWAQKSHEPYDADDKYIRIFDSEGRLLKMTPLWESYEIRLSSAEETPSHLEELTGLLRHFLPRIGVSESEAAGMSRDEMLNVIYNRDPNPYTAYRRPGEPRRGFWTGLKEWFFFRPNR